MAEDVEVFDSQFISENIGFLDCFDSPLSLHESLYVVKDYYDAEKSSEKPKSRNDTSRKLNITSRIISCLETSNQSIRRISQAKIQNVKCSKKLCEWGLPHDIVKKYEQRGITEMFDWQVTCLSNTNILNNCFNLVYSAPTSAGKTLVAEVLSIKTLLERRKKVLIILPFVSIVREKMMYLQDILSSSGIRVEGFMGSQAPSGGLQAVHVAICTIEKANSLVNRLLDDGNISDLGTVVVDELHLLGDAHRGYILELLLTKVKYVTSHLDNVQIQVIGMSATLPNLKVLAEWLDAELFVTDFRPIPLEEYCLVGSKYYNKEGKYVKTVGSTLLNNEGDSVLKICLETITDSCSILIFCMTKNRCESLAQNIAASFYKLGCAGNEIATSLRKQLNSESISEVLEQLKNCPVGLDQVLKKTISFGVAYHHAGLTFDERDIIEGGFKSGAIRVLVATSTLSSGVNLPARKVIVRSPVFLRQPINISTYKQMIGRAGRMGRDTKGESILICTEGEKKIGFDLMMGALDPVKSCIDNEDKYMRAILEMIANEVACTEDELVLYSKCTLLFSQQVDETDSQNFLLDDTLKHLKHFELIRAQTDGDITKYVATPLGKGCLSSSLAPNDGLSLFCELQRARQCLVLENDLHLIYLVTPYSVSSQWGELDWLHFLTLWESLTKAMKKVGELVGVQESFIVRSLRGVNNMNNDQSKLVIHKRFYTALALQDLVNEVPLTDVANKFQCARGFLQGLQQAAATFAGMVTAFCHQLGWKNMELLISQFQDRLQFGIHSELLDLMKLPSLNGMRARALFDAGLEEISSIAASEVNVIENVLYKAIPFQSEKERDGDDDGEVRKRNKIKNIWITGCRGMTAKEAAENLIEEARKYLEREIGVAEIKWNVKSEQLECTAKEAPEIVKVGPNNISLNNGEPRNKVLSPKCTDSQKMLVDGDGDNLQINEDIDVKDTVHLNQNEESVQVPDGPIISMNSFDNHRKPLPSVSSALNTHKNEASQNEEVIWDSLNITQLTFENRKQVNTTQQNMIIDSHTETCSSTPIQKLEANYSSTSIKNEPWESFDISDNIFKNVTKERISENIFSPDTSIGEAPERNASTKTTTISVKDVSIFSTDGDNSSLFEESFRLDSVSSKLLDVKDIARSESIKKETTTDSLNFNTNSILDAFKSTLVHVDNDVDEEDIKLVYEDDNGDNCFNQNLDMSADDEVVNTLQSKQTFDIDKFKSPLKRNADKSSICAPVAKKAKEERKIEIKDHISLLNSTPDMKNQNSTSLNLKILKHEIICYILRGNDILTFLTMLENVTEASLIIDTQIASETTNQVIGGNVLKSANSIQNNYAENKAKKHSIRIAIYYDRKSILLDLSSLDNLDLARKSIISWFGKNNVKLRMMAFKSNFVKLKKSLDVELPVPCVDILLSEWMVNNEEKVPNMFELIKKYLKFDLSTVPIVKSEQKPCEFQQLKPDEGLCVKVWCVWMIAEAQTCLVEPHERSVLETEIKVSKILGECEVFGLTVDKDLASKLLIDVKRSRDLLEAKAYKICGGRFNFRSTKDVAKALGIHKGRKVSTKKSVLTTHSSPLASFVIYWRKLDTILTKTLFPLTETACMYSQRNRIHPTYTQYSCTGRISMHEPNLQNVPRTFSIPGHFLSEATPPRDVVFNCRDVFRASPGWVIVSADYCQLEMRVLAHYSQDRVLVDIMRSDVDVFRSIAAKWGGVTEEEVDDDLRQKAKQLCYGILYGMGLRTLSQMLDVSELDASVFMDSFYKTYPAVRQYTQSVVQECRERGYVETLLKRRRYLPEISSRWVAKKSTAERQAVNTTVQGSAADIAKAAMCGVEARTRAHPRRPRLLLQMHDELIYEVQERDRTAFIRILKEAMETTVELTVPLPVKVKTGYTWGSLKEECCDFRK